MSILGKCIMIVNPASGTVSKHRIVPHVLKHLETEGVSCTVMPTEYPGHAREIAIAAATDKVDTVLVCGGDGTVNEAASGLCGSSTAMGIIPAGSGNGLARHLGIPVDIDSSLRVILHNNIIAADYGTANDKPFFCTFGVGFDAAVSERCARQKRRGIMMYLKNTINEYVNYSPEEYIIEANGKVITDRAFLVVCCNASQYGNNAFVAPQASITDGELDITIVHAGNLITQALVGIDMLTGFIGNNALVDTIRAKGATIRRRNAGYAHLDGDAVEMPDVIEVKCHPSKLRIFAPTKSTRFFPVVTPAYLAVRDAAISLRHILPIHK